MKKLLFFLACIMLAFASCKKDSVKTSSSTIATNTISVTIGGVTETFSTAVSAQLLDTPQYSLDISGFRGSGTTQEGLQIGISSIIPIVKGTYTVSTTPNYSSLPIVIYYKGLTSANLAGYGTDFTGAHVTTVAITSVSSTNVQGTFSGVLVNENGTSADTQTITNGKFNVDITK